MSLTAYNHVPVPSFMYGTAWKKEATTQLVQLGRGGWLHEPSTQPTN